METEILSSNKWQAAYSSEMLDPWKAQLLNADIPVTHTKNCGVGV